MFLATRPDDAQLATLLDRARELPLSYAPTGIARERTPVGFRVDEERAVLGNGSAAYARAVQALSEWRHFDLGWAGIYPKDAPLEPGSNVLVVARHFGFWSVNACRVVYLLPDPASSPPGWGQSSNIAGFAYGTLTEHAESGEEIFQVSFDPANEEVSYLVRAASRERAFLARVGFPIARAFQNRFRRDSADAMRRSVAQQLQA